MNLIHIFVLGYPYRRKFQRRQVVIYHYRPPEKLPEHQLDRCLTRTTVVRRYPNPAQLPKLLYLSEWNAWQNRPIHSHHVPLHPRDFNRNSSLCP